MVLARHAARRPTPHAALLARRSGVPARPLPSQVRPRPPVARAEPEGAGTTATTTTVPPAASDVPAGAAAAASSSSPRPALPSPPAPPPPPSKQAKKGWLGLGDLLGPIGLTLGGGKKKENEKQQQPGRLGLGTLDNMLGPIGLTVGRSSEGPAVARVDTTGTTPTPASPSSPSSSTVPLRNTLSTAEWRARYEDADGRVDLWVEEEFNAGSRLVGGRAAHFGAVPGAGSGEGRTGDAAVPAHAIRILNPATGQDVRVVVPEDRYILHEAEDQGLLLPYACRMGCCTACAVRVTEADGSAVGGAGSAVSTTTPPLLQPESLGIAAELRARGFALMCVSRPTRAVTLTLAEEDELYDLQFGDAFDEIATNPDGPGVERDDFALEIANMDE